MINKIKKMLGLMVWMAPVAVVQAHPGLVEGGGLVDGVIHFFSSADHLLLTVVIVVGLFYLKRKLLLQQ